MAHCNTGYCTTLLHNKDVALKGFLLGCRSTRLNHVTLVFTVFLFYTSSFASTLAYTTWYNTSLLIIFIFKMVSKSNFVLGIKQKSLASKEDSQVHITDRSHTCLSAGSRLHSISQSPWLTVVSRSSSPSNLCLSLSNLCTTSLRLMKPTRQTCSTAYRDQNPGTWPPMAAARRWRHRMTLYDISSSVSARGRRVQCLSARGGEARNPGGAWWRVQRRMTTRFSGQVHWWTTRPSWRRVWLRSKLGVENLRRCVWELEVITPRQQPRKHVHISPSPRQRHIIGWCQRLCCSTRDSTRKPGTDPDQYPLTLTLDQLTFDQKSKFSTRRILLSFSCRFRFWTPFLHLKLQNWSIGTFFIVASSKAFFTASPSDLLMLVQPQAFIELPPWVWGRVLEIYIRHISPM